MKSRQIYHVEKISTSVYVFIYYVFHFSRPLHILIPLKSLVIIFQNHMQGKCLSDGFLDPTHKTVSHCLIISVLCTCIISYDLLDISCVPLLFHAASPPATPVVTTSTSTSNGLALCTYKLTGPYFMPLLCTFHFLSWGFFDTMHGSSVGILSVLNSWKLTYM